MSQSTELTFSIIEDGLTTEGDITYDELTMTIAEIEQHFMSQSDTESNGVPPYLARTTCGITSLHIALSQLGFNHNTVEMYNQNIARIIALTSSDVPHTTVPASIGPLTVDVTVAYFPEPSSVEERIALSRQLLQGLGAPDKTLANIQDQPPAPAFQPGFTIERGTDHRALGTFMDEQDIPVDHELVENTTLEAVAARLAEAEANSSLALISVQHVYLGIPAHVLLTDSQLPQELPESLPASHITSHIVVLNKVIQVGGEPCAIISDPAATNPNDGIRIVSMKLLSEGFSGHASLLKKRQQ